MPTFVGRADELHLLEDVVAAADAGATAAVVVGDPGTGKTRLLQEVSERARAPNCFRVIGYEPESKVPLASASEFLRQLAEATPHGHRLEGLVFAADRGDAGPPAP